MRKERRKRSKKPRPNSYLKYSGIAFQMIAIILIGIWGGIQLDNYLQYEFPVFTLSCSVLAVIISLVQIIKQVLND